MLTALGALVLGPAVMFSGGSRRYTFTRSLLRAIVSRLPNPRVIYDRDGRSPYLTRYYLVHRPYMPDGSDPFDDFGDPKPESLVNKSFGVYLHHFHRSDEDGECHNHPWQWSLAIILAGGYSEERRTKDDTVVRRVKKPGSINMIRATDFHRVDLIEHDAWTLFIAGPKVATWGFWNRDTKEYLHWRDFIDKRRGTTKYTEGAK